LTVLALLAVERPEGEIHLILGHCSRGG
jgi:hypothetical protein